MRVTNVRAPIALDASQSPWPIASANGVICIKMVHISPWGATLGLIRGAAAPRRRSISTARTNAKGSNRHRATKRSTEAFAIAIRPGDCENSKRSPRWRNPPDSRFRLSRRCRQTICAWCSAGCDLDGAWTICQRTVALMNKPPFVLILSVAALPPMGPLRVWSGDSEAVHREVLDLLTPRTPFPAAP
jgi:hypothetical protein